jgi:hypothetical protein
MKVDWNRLIENAVTRRAPFEEGEKEKGFRDALIYECLLQLRHRPKLYAGLF